MIEDRFRIIPTPFTEKLHREVILYMNNDTLTTDKGIEPYTSFVAASNIARQYILKHHGNATEAIAAVKRDLTIPIPQGLEQYSNEIAGIQPDDNPEQAAEEFLTHLIRAELVHQYPNLKKVDHKRVETM